MNLWRTLALFLVVPAVGLAAAADLPSSFDECKSRVASRPDDLDSYHCFWILSRQNRADEAEAHLRAILAQDPTNHPARLFLGRIGVDRGRDWAEPMSREVIAAFSAAGNAEGEVLARDQLSVFLTRRHRFDELEIEVDAMHRVAEASEDRMLLARARHQQGALFFRRGDYSEAQRFLKEVEREIFPDGPLDLQARVLGSLAGVAQETGRIQESVEYLRRAADLHHRGGDYYDEARVRGNLVLSGFRLGIQGRMKAAEIEVWAREALAAAVASGNTGSQARGHLYLADLLSGLEAREHYRQGLEISRGTKEVAGLILGLRGLAMNLVESAPTDPNEAYQLVDRANALARGSRWWTVITRLARARIRWITGPREQAIADSLSALEAVEAIRDRQLDDLVRARVFSMWAFAYYRLAGHLLASAERTADDLELAFSVAERMRARVLLDELDAAQATASLAPGGAARERHDEMLKQISGVQRRLMNPSLPSAERRRTIRELEALEVEEARIRAGYADSDPEYKALRQPEQPTLLDVQHALRNDEALLSFQIATRRNLDNRTTQDASWIWVHTRTGTKVYSVPDRDELRSRLALYLGLLERRDGSELRGAVVLHRELLAAALGDLPAEITRLVIVPDGVLHRLPFGTLRAGKDKPPLASRYQISLQPSVTLWHRLRGSTAAPGAIPAVALADPVVPQSGPTPALLREWEAFSSTAPPGALPFARREGRALVSHLGGGSLLLVGEQATEHFLKQTRLSQFGIVHFAAHALLDEQHPERSAVLLAPGSTDEDGLLQIREIVDLDFDGRTIVLSACRSAAGELLEGEGVMGLARAFFQAGARAVVGSLQPLRDEETAEFLDDFYGEVAEGRSLADALATVRRERIQSHAPAAAWASLVLLGDGEIVPLPGGRQGGPFRQRTILRTALFAAIALAIVLALANFKRSALRPKH